MADKLYPFPGTSFYMEYPNTAKYMMLYSPFEMMSKWESTAPYKDREEVYGVCLEKGVTWQELLNFKGYDEKTLL